MIPLYILEGCYKVALELSLLQAEQSQSYQPVFPVLWPFLWPSSGPVLMGPRLSVLETPELDTELQLSCSLNVVSLFPITSLTQSTDAPPVFPTPGYPKKHSLTLFFQCSTCLQGQAPSNDLLPCTLSTNTVFFFFLVPHAVGKKKGKEKLEAVATLASALCWREPAFALSLGYAPSEKPLFFFLW